jgi:hypothetical protein
MALNKKIEIYLQKVFTPDARLHEKLLGSDITIVTNNFGEAVTLFIGKRRPDNNITGERYVRRIIRKPNSLEILRSHWELKGKV